MQNVSDASKHATDLISTILSQVDEPVGSDASASGTNGTGTCKEGGSAESQRYRSKSVM